MTKPRHVVLTVSLEAIRKTGPGVGVGRVQVCLKFNQELIQ